MTTPQTVLVHGATGTQGAPVVRRLLAQGHTVRALVRHAGAALPTGVQPVVGELDDLSSLIAAYDGTDAVVVQLPLVFGPGAVSQAQNVLDGLTKAAAPRVVFNTGGPIVPAPVGVPYLDARALLTSELARTVGHASIVGPAGPYMENLAAPWSVPHLRTGLVKYPLPAAAPVPWAALDDLAHVIGELLVAPQPAPVQVVVGPESLTGDQVAAVLSEAVGNPVRWETISAEQYGDDLAPHIGEEAARGIAGFYAPSDGPPPAPDAAAVRIGVTTLAHWAARQRW